MNVREVRWANLHQKPGSIQMQLWHVEKMPHCVWYWSQTMLSVLMRFCSALTHLRQTIKNLIRTITACFFWRCYPLTEPVSSTPQFINVLAAPCLSRVYPRCISESRDKYQHPPFICQGLRLDRKPLYWMSPSSVGSGPHSRMRYVTWATEVAMFPVCEGAWRLMGNEGERPFVLPLKGLVG